MKLYFSCSRKNKTFSSADYSLNPGYRIAEDQQGNKIVQGTVSLLSVCPWCGERHEYDAGEIMCPLSGGKDGK